MKNPVSISLIVPVYDEEYDVVPNITALLSKLEDILAKDVIGDYELLVFLSAMRMFNFWQRQDLVPNERIKFINHNGNTKLGNIFTKGIQFAQKKYVGLIPPYNQVNLDSLESILEALSTHDLIVAYIGNHSARPWYRMILSEMNTVLVNLFFGLNLKYYHLNFYRTSLVKRVRFTTDSHAAMVEATVWLAKSGASLSQVPFMMIPHNFKSKSHAFDLDNIWLILRTYARLFWQITICRKRINLN